MSIQEKICGIAAALIGAGLLYAEYILISAIGALGGWIANFVGATGGAHTGITLLAYLPVIGLIMLILFGACVMFLLGWELFFGE